MVSISGWKRRERVRKPRPQGKRAADISNGLPGQGRPIELPSGGMPGPSGNEDSDAGTLLTLECPGHRGHSGGGKPPPPMVQPMLYAGPLAGTERQAPYHSSVRQGSGAERKRRRLA